MSETIISKSLSDLTNQYYEDLKQEVEPVRECLFSLLERDGEISLSTDELSELVDDMIVAYVQKGVV